jgi:predicted RNA binding protein YcfA (HicA-like mRNA interferase family)
MPKLPGVKPREVIRFLEQHGFVLDHVSGSHFIFLSAVEAAGGYTKAQS